MIKIVLFPVWEVETTLQMEIYAFWCYKAKVIGGIIMIHTIYIHRYIYKICEQFFKKTALEWK